MPEASLRQQWRHSEHPRQDAEADEACARLVQSAENQRQCSDVCRGQGGLSVEPELGMFLKGGHLLGREMELEELVLKEKLA